MTDILLPRDTSPEATAEADFSTRPPLDSELRLITDLAGLTLLPAADVIPVLIAEAAAEPANVALMRRIVRRMRAAGLTVVEVAGWETRGRPGMFDPVGLLQHHDASPASVGVRGYLSGIVRGRADLAGPLAQWQLARDGIWYLVAAGRANHAGAGGPWRIIPVDSGNRYLMGSEVANDGKGEPYPQVQADALDVGLACQLIELDRDATWLRGHKEWATPPGRKTDPRMSMFRQRADVARARAVLLAPPKPAPTPEVDDMPAMALWRATTPIHSPWWVIGAAGRWEIKDAAAAVELHKAGLLATDRPVRVDQALIDAVPLAPKGTS